MDFRNRKGITIVALIVTVIVLLILAGVSIAEINGTGLFAQAQKAKLETKRSSITEWLNIKLIEEKTNNPSGTAEEIIKSTRENIINNKGELLEIGKKVEIEDIKDEEDGKKTEVYFYVIVDEDIYKVEQEGIKLIGKSTEFSPIIKITEITNTTNTITVKVETQRNEGGKIEYWIKTEDEEEYKLKETKKEEQYIYEGLKQDKKYNIKIVAVAKNKKTAEILVDRTTGNVPDLTEEDINFTYKVEGQIIDKEKWTNKEVTVEASTTVTGYTLQTSKDGEKWEDKESQTFKENGTIYVRLWDGTNYGGTASGNVTRIDTTAANINNFEGKASSTIASQATLTTTVRDANSGISKILWQWGTSTNYENTKTDIYAEEGTGITGNTIKTCSLTGLNSGTTYYAKITVYDMAGNETIQTTTLKTGTAVAQVGNISYTSVQNAISAISTSSSSATEIKLLINRTESITIPSGKKISFNLNEKTLSYNNTIITNNGTLRLYGGTVQTTGNIQSVINKGNMSLYSGNIQGNEGWILSNIGVFNMSGGNITSKSASNGAAVMNTGTFNMSAGKIEGDKNGIATRGGNTTISGGNIISNASSSSNNWAFIVDTKGVATVKNATITGTNSVILTNKKDGSSEDYVGKSLVITDSTITGKVRGNVIRVSGRTGGYSIYYYDTYQEYSTVTFPTWTNNNGQDDLVWHNANSGTLNDSKVWYYDISKSDRT